MTHGRNFVDKNGWGTYESLDTLHMEGVFRTQNILLKEGKI
jgi:hypothetical protein